jgi:hypothetical protein
VERWLLEGAPVEAWTREQRMEALRLAARSGDAEYLDNMRRIVNLVPDSSVLAAAAETGSFQRAYEMLVLPMVHADPLCVPTRNGMLGDAFLAAVRAGQPRTFADVFKANNAEYRQLYPQGLVEVAARCGNMDVLLTILRDILPQLWETNIADGSMYKVEIDPQQVRMWLFCSPLTVSQLLLELKYIFSEEDEVHDERRGSEGGDDPVAVAAELARALWSDVANNIIECAACSASPDWEVKLDAAFLVARSRQQPLCQAELSAALGAAAAMSDGEARVQRLLPLLLRDVEHEYDLEPAMTAAARSGRWPTLRLLLDHAPEEKKLDAWLPGAVKAAAAHGQMEVLQNLMAHHHLQTSSARSSRALGGSLLRAAAGHGRLEAFRWLLSRGAAAQEQQQQQQHDAAQCDSDLIFTAARGGNATIVADVCALYASRGCPLPSGCVGAAIEAGSVAAVRHLLAAGAAFETGVWRSAVRHGDLLMLRALRDTPVGAVWPTAEGLERLKADLATYNLAAVTWMVTEGGLGSAATAGDWEAVLPVFRQLSNLDAAGTDEPESSSSPPGTDDPESSSFSSSSSPPGTEDMDEDDPWVEQGLREHRERAFQLLLAAARIGERLRYI